MPSCRRCWRLGGCQTFQAPLGLCAAGEEMVETQLFFGLSKPRGVVTAAEWADFVRREIVPRFAEGFTVVDAQGVYRDESRRTISERTKLVLRLHPKGAAENRAIAEIVATYKQRFAQESVLRVDRAVCGEF